MIKSIKLKEKDLTFLKEVCGLDVLEKNEHSYHFEEKSSSWILILNSEELEIICDKLLEVLMDKGITKGEINAVGKIIDDYIDKF
jgi:hypothetical protein